jgi:hypothetical protein
MAVKKGYNRKLYRETGGTFGSPTWNLVDNVKDVTAVFPKDQLEASTRASSKLKEYEPGRGDFSITGMIRVKEDDTDFTAFETAWLADSELDLMILDGANDVTGSRGYRMKMKLFSFDEDSADDGVLFRSFELKPCISSDAKQTVVVTAGSPVYTTMTNN